MSWTSLCSTSELIEGRGKYVEIGGFHLAVFLDGEKIHVLDNYCPHAGGNLAAGFVEDGCAVCPWHFWAFRLENGTLRDTGTKLVKTYPIRIFPHDGEDLVQADLPIV